MAPLSIDGTRLRDSRGREFTFRGINVSADSKFPRRPDQPSHEPTGFYEDQNVSFVGRPFNEEEAHIHFGRLRRWGYNGMRYIFTWESLEHAGPGKYDEEYIQHIIKMLELAKEYGFYVFMDPHQDVWSRFTGGSGAPLWTVYAAGLDPHAFNATQAAIVHNTSADPAQFPKMLWPTNYQRLATSTMFTLFYAGKDYAPKAIINGQNIQDYLTDHFIGACKHLAQRIHEAGGLEDECIIGWESMNEPNRGLIGWQDMTLVPEELKMRKGTCPTPWQSLLTGSGRAVEIDTYEFGSFGPYKSGKELVDPKGRSAWLSDSHDDTKYGWKRDPDWKLGQCLWAQHGVWDPKTDDLLQKNYFANIPGTGKMVDIGVWSNTYFLDHVRKYRDAIRSVHKNCMFLMQSAVLEIPPSIKGTSDDEDRLIFASHYYDGLTLLTKHWNKIYNVDIVGVMRGKYSNPAFGVKLGETAIRNSFREQLEYLRLEGIEHMGEHPVMFTEIGIPYDMDDKYAYKTGDYSSQCAAMDANHFALEGSGVCGYTLWTYCGENNHQWGDMWNGEDLSIFSIDDTEIAVKKKPSLPPSALQSSSSVDRIKSASSSSSSINPSNVKDHIREPQISTDSHSSLNKAKNPGLRAGEAFVRPSPVATVGQIKKYVFDLRKCTFSFTVIGPDDGSTDQSSLATEIYLPEVHFPGPGNPGGAKTTVQVTAGTWRIDPVEIDGIPGMQVMKWWHGPGEQTLTVKGPTKKLGVVSNEPEEPDEGYYDTVKKVAGECSIQ